MSSLSAVLTSITLLAGTANGGAQLVGDITLPSDVPGGLSGIEVAADGQQVLINADRGSILTAVLTRDDAGKLNGFALGKVAPLTDGTGVTLDGDEADAEGLAIAADGSFFVSFEHDHRILHYARVGDPATPVPGAADFANFQPNSGLEALAIGSDGTLYTIPERSGAATTPFPVFHLQNDGWETAFEIPRRGSFLVTGADIGPDGLIYVLERDFYGIGFRSRIRRFALDGTGEEVLLETALGTHGNLEGISVWQAADGLRMTLIADNNENRLNPTHIVEYLLAD